jgi:hypothetical protein
MTTPRPSVGRIHPAVFRQEAGFLRWVPATPRPHGAVRYRCPVSNSFVVVTDETELAALARPRARLRCLSCGEMHLLTQNAEAASVDDPAPIVTAARQP